MAIAFVIAAIACALYGVAILATWSGTSFFAVWFVLAAVFFALALGAHLGVWGLLPRVARWVVGVAVALGLAAFAGLLACSASGFSEEGEPGLDYIIVLGAQVKPAGNPSVVLEYRLDAALEYLEANPDTKCIVSGGQGPNEPTTEAACMAAWLAARGVDEDRIIQEGRSTNTLENIRFSMEFIDPATDRVGIVTNNFHVFRGVRIAHKQGIEHACGISAYSKPFYLPNNMLRETLGIAKDLACGNM